MQVNGKKVDPANTKLEVEKIVVGGIAQPVSMRGAKTLAEWLKFHPGSKVVPGKDGRWYVLQANEGLTEPFRGYANRKERRKQKALTRARVMGQRERNIVGVVFDEVTDGPPAQTAFIRSAGDVDATSPDVTIEHVTIEHAARRAGKATRIKALYDAAQIDSIDINEGE